MARQVSVNVPGTRRGEEVEVFGLGVYKNGNVYQVTKEQADTYETVTGQEFPGSGIVVGERLSKKAQKPIEPEPRQVSIGSADASGAAVSIDTLENDGGEPGTLESDNEEPVPAENNNEGGE